MTGEKGLVVVTGASGGIGYELARLFARDGYPLLLTARSGDKLQAFAAELTAAHGVPVGDVHRSTWPCQTPPTSSSRRPGGRNGPSRSWSTTPASAATARSWTPTWRNVLQILQVNIVALTHLTRLFLPDMVRRNGGRIMNVASVAAFQPGPLMAVYYASKAYVLSLSEALDEELRKTKVRISAFLSGADRHGVRGPRGPGASRSCSPAATSWTPAPRPRSATAD